MSAASNYEQDKEENDNDESSQGQRGMNQIDFKTCKRILTRN